MELAYGWGFDCKAYSTTNIIYLISLQGANGQRVGTLWGVQ